MQLSAVSMKMKMKQVQIPKLLQAQPMFIKIVLVHGIKLKK